MRIIIILILFILVSTNSSEAKLLANFSQNKAQYGEPVMLQKLPTARGFTGFATYWLDENWKLVAFFRNDIVHSEHLVPRETRDPQLSRDEVRNRAFKMFPQVHRGPYRKELKFPKSEGHFFDKGLISYEYKMSGKKIIGYKGIKVLVYENGSSYHKINPKAYL